MGALIRANFAFRSLPLHKPCWNWLPAVVALCAAMSGCGSAVQIYSPRDLRDAPPSGEVLPLEKILTGSQHIKLVFVHGVGDHCRGYAIGNPETGAPGWLNDKALKAIGLKKGTYAKVRRIEALEFNGVTDPRSFVWLNEQSYTLPTRDGPDVDFVAEEITWSPMTQWVKSNLLSYEKTEAIKKAGDPDTACVAEPTVTYFQPPHRALANKIIKEQTFDRNLADTVIYVGTYGGAIQHGVGAALCRILSPRPDETPCTWSPDSEVVARQSKYVFVTHSLGGRVLYDTLLSLTGYETKVKPNPFAPEYWSAAQDAVNRMVVETPAIYMMANQLALLGLANVPSTTTSSEPLHPYVEHVDLSRYLPALKISASETDAASKRITDASNKAAQVRSSCPDPLNALADQRRKLQPAAEPLHIVSFNDTNDLLTWHIPSWYENDGTRPDDCRPAIAIADVFVQNATPWLGFVEWPATAHSGYFKNDDVLKVIRCGGKGKPSACAP